MLTRQELEGKWKQIKGEIRNRWGNLTDDDFQQVKGDAEKLVGVIQEKTGQSRKEIEAFLDRAAATGQGAVQQVTERAQQFADVAGKKVQEGYEAASRNLQDTYHMAEEGIETGYNEARKMVRTRPMESVMTAFGVGLIAGVVVSLMMRSQRS
jgi:uncharacterized protein YjbJ (UPF0337 family)